MTRFIKPDETRDGIYLHMLSTRGTKYLAMILALRFANLISRYVYLSPERGELVESYYVMMRYVDDVVDGDAKLPKRFSSAVEFVENKIDFSRTLSESPAEAQPVDVVDRRMVHCYDLAARLGFGIDEETDAILSSMLFDARRLLKAETDGIAAYSRKELADHFDKLDIVGTISGIIKARGGYSGYIELLLEAVKPLGTASRIFYTLQDYNADIRAKLLNIPSEDMDTYQISKEELLRSGRDLEHILKAPKLKPRDLGHVLPLPVRGWFLQEAAEGLRAIGEYKRNMAEVRKEIRIDRLSSTTLYLMYEVPSNNFFRGVLTNLG